MFDLQALEQALSVVETIGKGEITFDVGGTSMTLRLLLPDEEVEVQKYAQASLAGQTDEGGTDRHAAMEFLDHFKQAVLSYALIEIGHLDLRNVKFIETGEVLSSGVKVRIEKHIAVRKMIEKWVRPVLLAVFKKYSELVDRVEGDAEKAVEYTPSDLDAELERIEGRLAELKTKKEQNSTEADRVKDIGEMGEEQQGHTRRMIQTAVNADTAAEPELTRPRTQASSPQATESRQSVIPPRSAPPTRAPVVQSPVVIPAARPSVDDMSSFVDVSDEEALAAESRRLMEARAKARQAEGEASSRVTRVPPHRAAANLANAVVDMGGGVAAARPAGVVDGVETFRVPTETLSERGQAPPRPKNIPLNVAPAGKANPRFRPSGG